MVNPEFGLSRRFVIEATHLGTDEREAFPRDDSEIVKV